MKEVLVEGEGLNKQRKNVCIVRGGGSSTVAIPLGLAHGLSKASETMSR